jgi:hypothetical protein
MIFGYVFAEKVFLNDNGIHHDDFPDRESEYVAEIVKDLLEINEIELDEIPQFKGTRDMLDKL